MSVRVETSGPVTTVVGLGRALDLILTGRHVDTREAERIGLANRFAAGEGRHGAF